jgi:hypothetical protein
MPPREIELTPGQVPLGHPQVIGCRQGDEAIDVHTPQRLDQPAAQQPVAAHCLVHLTGQEVPVDQAPGHCVRKARGAYDTFIGVTARALVRDEGIHQPRSQPPGRDVVLGRDPADRLRAVGGECGLGIAELVNGPFGDLCDVRRQLVPQVLADGLEQRWLHVTASQVTAFSGRGDAGGMQVTNELPRRLIAEDPARGQRWPRHCLNRTLDSQRRKLVPGTAADGGCQQVKCLTPGRHQKVQPRVLLAGLDQFSQELPPPSVMGAEARIGDEVVQLIDGGVGDFFSSSCQAPHEFAHCQSDQSGRDVPW